MLIILDKTIKENGENKTLCKCSFCGTKKFISNKHLKDTMSCGCMKGKVTHKKSKTRLYTIYNNMKQRCYNSNNFDYKYYGGKGIKICNEWLNSFVSFYNWSINNGYKDNLTIERKDINKDYCPTNCTWFTRKEQMQNTTRNNYYEAFNETGTIRFFSDKYKIPYNHLRGRIRYMSMEEAIKMGKGTAPYTIQQYEYKGLKGSRKQICDKLGVNYYTIKSRMNIYKMSFEDAINKSLDED